jgi:hypothetical protein
MKRTKTAATRSTKAPFDPNTRPTRVLIVSNGGLSDVSAGCKVGTVYDVSGWNQVTDANGNRTNGWQPKIRAESNPRLELSISCWIPADKGGFPPKRTPKVPTVADLAATLGKATLAFNRAKAKAESASEKRQACESAMHAARNALNICSSTL